MKEYSTPELVKTSRRQGWLEDVVYADAKPFFLIRAPGGEIATYPGAPAALAGLAHGPGFDFPTLVDFDTDEAGRIVSIALVEKQP